MAVTNYVTLSSSPIRNTTSSSPGLPSPSQLFMSKAVRPSSGGAAVPISQDAYIGFTSTYTLPESGKKSSTQKARGSADARFILKAKELLEGLGQNPPEPAGKDQQNEIPTCQHRVRKSTGTVKPRISPKLSVINADAENKEGGHSGERRRCKQSTKDEQTKIQKTKVTKPGVAAAGAKRRKAKATATDRALEGSGVERQKKADTKKDAPASRKEVNLGLTEALKRRQDWTPQKRSSVSASQLVSGFLPATAKSAPGKRPRSPKKKPQTITDKATAPFAADSSTSASIRDYFPTPSQDVQSRLVSGVQGQSVEKGKEDVPTRKASKFSKVKKKTKQPVVILSPESTMKILNEQDLLFGTSSQLVREESPTHIRDIQQAMKESELHAESPSVSCQNDSQISLQSDESKVSSLKFATATRNLWSAAARDDAGSLLNVDVVDLVETPQLSRSLPLEVGKPKDTEATDAPVEGPNANVDGDWQFVDGEAKDVRPEDENSIPRSVAEAALRERPRGKSPTKKQGKRKDTKACTTEISLPDMPHYSGFTDADLKKEVVAFGFKPMRRRQEMILLLQRCWESKNRSALQSLPPNVPRTLGPGKDLRKEVSTPTSLTELSTPTKKKGQQAKRLSVATENDSNTESVIPAKRPRGRPKKSTVTQPSISSLQTDTAAEGNSDAIHIQPPPLPRRRTTAKATSLPAKAATRGTEALYATITKAIKSYPPTHDARNLTWYEKMLIYDPVVLEDLADWLNKEGLGLVGCQDSITPGLTKDWCESQSICCVWRENLKGGTRARH
ncbi:MAG: hypothetical protein Q9208_006970 [Pyrenodesmia sp. 3 TL-2023]